MTLELKTDVSIPYLDEDDAFEIFVTTVNNGQTRLSLEVLVDIMATVLNKINELDENVSEIIRVLTDEDSQETVEQEEAKVEEQITVVSEDKKEETQEKTTPQKTKAKKEETEIKE